MHSDCKVISWVSRLLYSRGKRRHLLEEEVNVYPWLPIFPIKLNLKYLIFLSLLHTLFQCALENDLCFLAWCSNPPTLYPIDTNISIFIFCGCHVISYKIKYSFLQCVGILTPELKICLYESWCGSALFLQDYFSSLIFWIVKLPVRYRLSDKIHVREHRVTDRRAHIT
jgi:hypothetical protein